MATYAECLAALPSFRNDLMRQRTLQTPAAKASTPRAFSPRGAFAALATPLANIHATGVGIRQRGGRYFPDEHVIKVFVFEKLEGEIPGIPRTYGDAGVPVDVEYLPIQVVRAVRRGAKSGAGKRAAASRGVRRAAAAEVSAEGSEESGSQGVGNAAAAATTLPQRQRRRPIVGGLTVSPLNANIAGTLGCFLLRRGVMDEVFALSNNHVFAGVNSLPPGTPIVQPGPEVPPFRTDPQDAFAALHTVIPIRFPEGGPQPVYNRFDAALANVTDGRVIEPGRIFGMEVVGQGLPTGAPVYDPSRVVSPEPSMRVMKMGRTTGFTRGTITATNVRGVQVNYGTFQFPRIAVYQGVLTVVGDGGIPFSLPGDSGAVVLEEATGHPVGMVFAGDGVTTSACDLGALCQQLDAWPI